MVKNYTKHDVENHNTETNAWVIYRYNVYDITEFLDHHPGGKELLLPYLGKDISGVFPSNPLHSHSKSTFKILEKYKIGILEGYDNMDAIQTNKDPIDYDKGVLNQLGKIDNYNEWVYQYQSGTLKLFDSPYLEYLSKCHWIIVPLFWTPIIIYTSLLLWKSFDKSTPLIFRILYFICLTIFGIIQWTLLEYFIHRFIFHINIRNDQYWLKLFHFAVHGLHHKNPMDKYRLVFPPTPAVIAATILSIFYFFIFGSFIFFSLISGTITGYLMYDMTHYYIHFGITDDSPKYLKYLRSYHNDHHYRDHNSGFGITNSIWDSVFQTKIKSKNI